MNQFKLTKFGNISKFRQLTNFWTKFGYFPNFGNLTNFWTKFWNCSISHPMMFHGNTEPLQGDLKNFENWRLISPKCGQMTKIGKITKFRPKIGQLTKFGNISKFGQLKLIDLLNLPEVSDQWNTKKVPNYHIEFWCTNYICFLCSKIGLWNLHKSANSD